VDARSLVLASPSSPLGPQRSLRGGRLKSQLLPYPEKRHTATILAPAPRIDVTPPRRLASLDGRPSARCEKHTLAGEIATICFWYRRLAICRHRRYLELAVNSTHSELCLGRGPDPVEDRQSKKSSSPMNR